MAKDLNKVMIIGRLGRDPELRALANGGQVANFSLATSRQLRDTGTGVREETEWFNVVAYDRLAEICNQYLRKGSRVYIEGRLQTRQFQDRNGATQYRTEVITVDMNLLDGRNDRGDAHDEPPQQRDPSSQADWPSTDDDLPF